MAYEKLKQRLEAGEVIILDGATGTELQRRGAPMDPAAWSGPATLQNDKLLTEIHADYIRAGAEVITANTFASSRLMLSRAGYGDRVEEINRRTVEAALRARDGTPGGAEVVVAGSLSHMVPITEGTAGVDPKSVPEDAEFAAACNELARILATAGCELIILEMMYVPKRIRLALDAALATGLPVWFGLSARRGKDGRAISFDQLDELPLDKIAGLIPKRGVDAAGVMHTRAELIAEALDAVRRHFDGPLMAYPDSGYFEMPDWRFVDVITPQRFETFCGEWIKSGVQILGGCCGLSVEHIQAAVRARDAAV
ncbi:MAG TPA: homocysteine S-methyltransferase family protein [Alphaproteobacteria bacterium]|nr:homocysteine S-methyltransferase family protein [Alphaproteobacteria bacterium]